MNHENINYLNPPTNGAESDPDAEVQSIYHWNGQTFQHLYKHVPDNLINKKIDKQGLMSITNFCTTFSFSKAQMDKLILDGLIALFVERKSGSLYVLPQDTFYTVRFEEKISLFRDHTTSRIKIIIDIILYLGAVYMEDKEMILLNRYFKNMELTIQEELGMVEEVELIIERFINNLIDLMYNKKKNEQQIVRLNEKINNLKQKIVKSLSVKVQQADTNQPQKLDLTDFFYNDFIDSELPPRLINILLKNNLNSPKDLLYATKEELLSLKNFGKKSYLELEQYFLQRTGLTMERLKNSL